MDGTSDKNKLYKTGKIKSKKKIKDFICAALRLHFSCKNHLNNLTLTHPWVRRVRRARCAAHPTAHAPLGCEVPCRRTGNYTSVSRDCIRQHKEVPGGRRAGHRRDILQRINNDFINVNQYFILKGCPSD